MEFFIKQFLCNADNQHCFNVEFVSFLHHVLVDFSVLFRKSVYFLRSKQTILYIFFVIILLIPLKLHCFNTKYLMLVRLSITDGTVAIYMYINVTSINRLSQIH